MTTILFVSASPDELNPNAYLIDYLVDECSQATEPPVTARRVEHRNLLLALEAIRPTAVVAVGSLMGAGLGLVAARERSALLGARFCYWAWDDPFELDANRAMGDLFDHVFTNDADSAQYYRSPSAVSYLPLAAAFAPHFRPVASAPPMWDWLIVGHAFDRRVHIAERLVRSSPELDGVVSGGGWLGKVPRCHVPGPIPNAQLADLYSRSGAVISVGRGEMLANVVFEVPARAVGPRVFEVALAGAPQILVPQGEPVAEERAVVDMIAADDAGVVELVIEIKARPRQVRAKLVELQETVLRNHLYRHRVATLVGRL
jgi:spore maturation protein CgeB